MTLDSMIDRRSALRRVADSGIGGLIALGDRGSGGVRANHARDMKGIYITWLDYTDADGKELGRIRPNVMLDISNHDELATPEDQRDWWLHVSIRNTGGADLVIEPNAFALWTKTGFLFRPHDRRPGEGDTGIVLDDADHGARLLVPGSGSLPLTSEPIPPRADRHGYIRFRVPVNAWLAGLLFTPEPERILVLARFPPSAGPIIID